MSVLEVDGLLSELASLSMWSDSSFRSTSREPDSPKHRTRKEILRTLYNDLPYSDACYLTQIILKDLRPVLYPTPGRNTTESLLGFKSDYVKMLSKEDAMRLWDDTGLMRKAFDARGTLEEAALVFEGGEEQVNPVVGKKLQVRPSPLLHCPRRINAQMSKLMSSCHRSQNASKVKVASRPSVTSKMPRRCMQKPSTTVNACSYIFGSMSMGSRISRCSVRVGGTRRSIELRYTRTFDRTC